jgi:hypothetical protein
MQISRVKQGRGFGNKERTFWPEILNSWNHCTELTRIDESVHIRAGMESHSGPSSRDRKPRSGSDTSLGLGAFLPLMTSAKANDKNQHLRS